MEIRLRRRPVGLPSVEDFEVVAQERPELAPGQVLVRNKYLAVEPGTRLFIDGLLPGIGTGDGLRGDAIGEVVESDSAEFKVGDIVRHVLGWREFAVGDASLFRPASPTVDMATQLNFGLLGYVGLLDVAELKPGETVWVSSAAGSIGSLAGQIARLTGATVIGSAGSAEKVRHLTEELGFTAAFDYHDGPIADRLREAAPAGLDVYFDNVGGDHLEAALEVLKPHGRVVLCGAMSQQGADTPPPGPRNLIQVIGKSLVLRGLAIHEHFHRVPAYAADFARWRSAGDLVHRQNIVAGVENTPQAFVDLLRGAFTGQVLVQVY
jgi:NADPH-dependent curcumin reductase CurA